ncbi:protein halfway isoform X7 [Nasonia vitripennis]|uniref:Protein halfway n=1 Tax=Nasonia vitripennis TaxID=7425 RepID=A0A7M7R2V7_NASVI|nr:protein halfway isoform X7 [Nasonia vitripennis]
MMLKSSFKIQWFTVMTCLYMTSARTEEDQSLTSNAHEQTTINTIPEKCFYRLPSECPPPGANPCRRITLSNISTEHDAIFCCNLISLTEFEFALSRANFPDNVSYIHIRNATLDFINVTEVRWRMLKSLAVTDGKIHRIRGQFLMMTPILCLNFSNNALLEMENNSLSRLTQLTTLDLSYNNLTHLPALNIMNGREFWLDISGSNTLLCHDIYQNINKTGENQIIFNRENETVCSSSKTWHWFNATAQVPLKQVRYLSSITVLDELSSNPSYDGLREFVADYNNISSINKLEGSKFLDSYAFLSLRHNKIKSLPTYILATNAYGDKSYSSSRYGVKFGGNELHCDCNTAKFLKVWLQTKIIDYDEVLCENVKEKVIDLEPSKMCVYPGDWTDYIYYIIATEVLLLISLIAKVSYDYWIFKTAGYLPWPANKMPKLPCDWLCET